MFSSIRFKLTLWYTCVLALIISAISLLTYTLLVRALAQQTDRSITEIARSVTGSVQGEQEDSEAGERSPDAAIVEALDEFHSMDYSFVVTRPDGTKVVDTGDTSIDLPANAAELPFRSVRIRSKPFRMGHSELNVGEKRYDLFVVYSLADQRELEESVRNIFFTSVPFALLLAALGGYFLAGRSLRPIAEMSRRATQISAANLHERLPVKNANDELGTLAAAFNDLLDRLDHEFDRQRRFVTDASHELRTPLAVIRGESDVALLNNERGADEYRDSLHVVNQESKRLSVVVEDLFTLARADSANLVPVVNELYVDEIVGECVRAVRTLADGSHIGIHLDTQELLVRGDEALLHRLFMNLLDNAIKYNYTGGAIRVTTDERSVTIGNTGKPIPPEHIGRIFERFYRSDKTHPIRHDSGGSGAGLGLSIAKAIADLHQAEIEYSFVGIENVFTVTFPR